MSGNFGMSVPTATDQIASDAINKPSTSRSTRSAHCKLLHDVPGLYSPSNSSNMHIQNQSKKESESGTGVQGIIEINSKSSHVVDLGLRPVHLKTQVLTSSKDSIPRSMHPPETSDPDLERQNLAEKCDRSVIALNDSVINESLTPGPDPVPVENGYHIPRDTECAGHNSVLQRCSLKEESVGLISKSLAGENSSSLSPNSHNASHTLSALDGSQMTSKSGVYSKVVDELYCDKKDILDDLNTSVPVENSRLKASDLLDQDSNEDSGVCSGISCHCSGKDAKDCFDESKELAQSNAHQGANDSSTSDVEFLLNKLEETTLDENVQTCSSDVINGISYVVYESEKQMPDIMRLITKDLSEPYSIYTYRYFIHNWPKLCFLAMADNKCVGAIVCKLDLHKKMVLRGYIAMLAVDSEYRRRQIGSILVTKAIQAMIRDDCDEVVLETEITNRAALQLYENLGFVRDKRLFRYYLNGVDALRLKLWLR